MANCHLCHWEDKSDLGHAAKRIYIYLDRMLKMPIGFPLRMIRERRRDELKKELFNL